MAAKKAKKTTKAKKVTKSATARAADRARVSSEGHELAYVAKKHGVDEAVVKRIIKRVGNMRTAVEKELAAFKKRSKAADRALVSKEPHELAYLAKKFGISSDEALAAVEKHGPSRKKIEAALTK